MAVTTIEASKSTKAPGTPPVMIGSKPSPLVVQGTPMRFLIMDAPRQANLHLYIKECRKHQVTDVVRVCEPTYSAAGLETAGIALHEMPYDDGHSPPEEVLDRWLKLVDERFYDLTTNLSVTSSASNASGLGSGSLAAVSNSSSAPSPCIAVHCVAGLGRAPVLVAIALIEFNRVDPVEAVSLIRRHRRGAINEKQLNWLLQYQRRYRRDPKKSCCVMM